MVPPEHCNDKNKLLLVWCHEESRVFRDRLISEEDRCWFNTALKNTFSPPCPVSSLSTLQVYQPINDREHLGELLKEYLEEYNMEFPSQMHLVFFADAVAHVSRICRVLRQPRGNALLVGVGGQRNFLLAREKKMYGLSAKSIVHAYLGVSSLTVSIQHICLLHLCPGSGRQSLTRLSAFVAGYKCVSIEITRGYGISEFHDDLKVVLMTAGAENVPTVFLFSDTQIVEEGFLEDLNNVLNSGEV
ncbi:unnamed protein product, partial [Choristocarpus tenellus]